VKGGRRQSICLRCICRKDAFSLCQTGLVILRTNLKIPFGRLRAFQNGSERTRSDADVSTHKKGAGRHADASDEADADQ